MTDDRAPILDAITGAEERLQTARADLAQLYDGTHVDAWHLLDALVAVRLAMTDLEAAITHTARKARAERVPWSAIGDALVITGQAAQQRYGLTD